MSAAGRLGDKAKVDSDSHCCPRCSHTAIGPALKGSENVRINGKPALRVGDPGKHDSCCGAQTWTAAKGSRTVKINGQPAHRRGDSTQHCGGVGILIEGSSDVNIGG